MSCNMNHLEIMNHESTALLERIATTFTTSDILPAAFLALARAIEHDDDDAQEQAVTEVRALLDWRAYTWNAGEAQCAPV